jgi:hypothetical protein
MNEWIIQVVSNDLIAVVDSAKAEVQRWHFSFHHWLCEQL